MPARPADPPDGAFGVQNWPGPDGSSAQGFEDVAPPAQGKRVSEF